MVVSQFADFEHVDVVFVMLFCCVRALCSNDLDKNTPGVAFGSWRIVLVFQISWTHTFVNTNTTTSICFPNHHKRSDSKNHHLIGDASHHFKWLMLKNEIPRNWLFRIIYQLSWDLNHASRPAGLDINFFIDLDKQQHRACKPTYPNSWRTKPVRKPKCDKDQIACMRKHETLPRHSRWLKFLLGHKAHSVNLMPWWSFHKHWHVTWLFTDMQNT